jgi:hypothetical protein
MDTRLLRSMGSNPCEKFAKRCRSYGARRNFSADCYKDFAPTEHRFGLCILQILFLFSGLLMRLADRKGKVSDSHMRIN